MSFEELYTTENDALHLSEQARQEISDTLAAAQRETESETVEAPTTLTPSTVSRPRPFWRRVWIPSVAAVACLFLLAIGLPTVLLMRSLSSQNTQTNLEMTDEAFLSELDGAPRSGRATSYNDIYDAIIETSGERWVERDERSSGLLDLLLLILTPARSMQEDLAGVPDYGGDLALPGAEESSSMSKRQSDSVQMTDDSGEKTFSTTNVQVEGVDEADIVKTDGEYLYILSYDELIIARADGKNTKVVSRTFVDLSRKAASSNRQNSTSAEIASDDVSMVSPVEFPTPMEMFLDGDRLIVLLTNYDANIYQESSRYNMPLSTQGAATFAITYDISDRMQPRKVAQSGQDGDYVTSRMQDGVIYLVTSYYIYQRPEFDDVRTFVPCLFAGDVRETMAPRDIIVPQSPSETGYTVITSISTKTGEHLDGQSLFGYISTVYMSHDSLVIAASVYEEKIIDRWIEDQYRVEHRRDGYHTHLAFFDIDRGDLTFVTESVVPGELLNQFSIDQYQDTTRVVTTVSTQEMKLYTDRKRGFMNYERIEDSPQTNALFVLDRKGEMIGKLTDLAPGEQVYSVRFAGEVGYFVTFRQVDPLFAIDLSDPRDPRVLSALKIPGFSQYLHVYGKGLLFGLGRDADEETGITGPIKLSMFDVSDPRDVRELDKLVTDIDHSEALYNHKAILVLPQIDLIAFPTFEGYALFGYQDGGFVSRGTIEFPNSYSARGVVIDDLLYVCTASSIGVFELNTFTPLITIWF